MLACNSDCVYTLEYLLSDFAFLVNYLEVVYGMNFPVLIRFGKWQEILDEPLPDDWCSA